jgi:hypothetical protein
MNLEQLVNLGLCRLGDIHRLCRSPLHDPPIGLYPGGRDHRPGRTRHRADGPTIENSTLGLQPGGRDYGRTKMAKIRDTHNADVWMSRDTPCDIRVRPRLSDNRPNGHYSQTPLVLNPYEG